ncbi:MAG: AAA family ATPase [Bacillota bacterium]|nr:AAA family ATPase [Bacillota bacterium]
MKITECYIENFGKLSKYSYSFKDGLNTINECNGWGKSTFAAFIRAMLYGMESSRARKVLDERTKYKPWQGGAFGGYIKFKYKDKSYKLERFFGDKEKDDTFTLYDEATGLISSDFTEEIGRDLFGLDKAAFTRSTFIPQNSIKTEQNDSLAAKLSNLLETDNDINNFDRADSLLENAKKKYKMTGGKGRIEEIKRRIAQIKEELSDLSGKEESKEAWTAKLSEITERKVKIKEDIKKVKEDIEKVSKYEGKLAKSKHYEELCLAFSSAENELLKSKAAFNGNPPLKETVDKACLMADKLKDTKGRMAAFLMSEPEESRFAELNEEFQNGIPKEEQIEEVKNLMEEYKEVKIRLDASALTEEEKRRKLSLDDVFKEGAPGPDEVNDKINKIDKLNETKETLSTEKSKLEILKLQKSSGKGNGFWLLLTAGFIAVLSGIVLMALKMFLTGAVLGVIGLAFLLAGILLRKPKQSKNNRAQEIQKLIEELSQKETSVNEELHSYLNKYSLENDNLFLAFSSLKSMAAEYKALINKQSGEDVKTLKNRLSELNEKLDNKMSGYLAVPQTIEEKESAWRILVSDRAVYLSLNEKSKNYEALLLSYKESYKNISELITPYTNDTDSIEASYSLNNALSEYNLLLAAFENAKSRKEAFEKETDTSELKNQKEPDLKMEDLRKLEEELDKTWSDVFDEEKDARGKILSLQDETGMIPELTSESDSLSEELSESEESFEVLSYAEKYLTEAKNSLTGRYMKGMNDSFKEYLDFLSGGSLGEAKLDVNLDVRVTEQGAQRSLEYYSTGYMDLIGLCARFALIKALFEDETPFVILDDPFVNLDGEKLANAKRLLLKLSKGYQIIYFVCHDARKV